MDMSVKVLRIGLRTVPLTRGMIAFRDGVFADLWKIAVFGPVIASEVVVPVLDLRAAVMIDVFASPVISAAFGIATDVSADLNANMRATATRDLDSLRMFTSSEEALLFGWEACI